jgi:hypothetical protein
VHLGRRGHGHRHYPDVFYEFNSKGIIMNNEQRPAPLHIFGAANPEQNEQLARDAQAIVDADVAALPKDCSGTPASCPDNEGYGCACSPATAPQAPTKLPKWIDEKKGSDPLVDDLIAYIEQHAVPQVVTESALVMASKQALEYIEGVAARTDKNAVWERCEAICSDLRAALQAAPVQAQEPFMYGIMGPDGKAHLDENCVGPNAASLFAELNGLNDSPDAGYRIVQLFTAPVHPVAVAVPDGCKSELSAYQYWASKQDGGFAPVDAWMGRAALAAPAAQGDAKTTTKHVCTNCAGEGRFYKTVMSDFGSGEREETVCKVCVGSGVIYAAIAAKATS